MFKNKKWYVSAWGSQILDGDSNVVLQAPDFLPKEKLSEFKDDLKLASHAPEMYQLLKSLLQNDSVVEDPWAEKMVYDLVKKIENK